MSKWALLSFDEMDLMSIGMIIDHVQTYAEFKNPDRKKNKVRKARQSDIEGLKGR